MLCQAGRWRGQSAGSDVPPWAGVSCVEWEHHSRASCSLELWLQALLWDDIGAGFTCLFCGEAAVITGHWVHL